MSLGSAAIIKNNLIRDVQAKQKRIVEAYERARSVAEQSMQANAPVLSGALKASSKAERLPNGIGFEMRSYGDESAGKAYAAPVNNGHFTKSGSFVAPQPYFSQAEVDAKATLSEALRQV